MNTRRTYHAMHLGQEPRVLSCVRQGWTNAAISSPTCSPFGKEDKGGG